jgi:AhpD family alkylhydroperoxidase
MPHIQIFDPALCCSTGVCGVEVDQRLIDFSAAVDWVKQYGAQIERFNLAQQPMAFAENAVVKSFLEQSGAEALPVVLVDGAMMLSGRYPSRDELVQWAEIDVLTPQVMELIALGAAVAAGCEPCFKFHYDKACKLGVTAETMQEAVAIGDMVKQASAQNMLQLAGRFLGKTTADTTGSTCCGGASNVSTVKIADIGGCCR